jgi:sugar lactone lactonase YvrE
MISILKLFSYDKTYFEFYKSNYFIGEENKIYIPYRLKISTNGDLTMSAPRYYTDYLYRDASYEPLIVVRAGKNNQEGFIKEGQILYSVMGYTIDYDNNYYILDQGIIDKNDHTTKSDSKVLVTDSSGKKISTYEFSGLDLKNSLLTDIAVDHDGKYIYITDSGNLKNKNSTSGLIVIKIDGEKYKVYKVLNNNHESFLPDKDFENIIYNTGNDIYDYFAEATGVNNIQISCNDETIYYSSIKSKKIYSVYTKDILNAIEKYETSNNKNDLDDITVKSTDRKFLSNNFIVSSKNNFFMINSEYKSDVEVSFSPEKDLSKYDQERNSQIKSKVNSFLLPLSLDINGGTLYLLDVNITDTGKIVYSIYTAKLKTDELDNNVGCTVFIFKIYGSVIFLFIWVFIILAIAVVLVIANSGNKIEQSNLRKEREKQEEINELNKTLNE